MMISRRYQPKMEARTWKNVSWKRRFRTWKLKFSGSRHQFSGSYLLQDIILRLDCPTGTVFISLYMKESWTSCNIRMRVRNYQGPYEQAQWECHCYVFCPLFKRTWSQVLLCFYPLYAAVAFNKNRQKYWAHERNHPSKVSGMEKGWKKEIHSEHHLNIIPNGFQLYSFMVIQS